MPPTLPEKAAVLVISGLTAHQLVVLPLCGKGPLLAHWSLSTGGNGFTTGTGGALDHLLFAILEQVVYCRHRIGP